MFTVLEKRRLNDSTVLMRVYAPRIAKKAKPGQFIIFRADEKGERVPLTIAGTADDGGVMIIFQTVGKSTSALAALNVGESVLDFVGPLGNPTELDPYLVKDGSGSAKRVAVIGGGLGCAIAYPQAKYLHDGGAQVDIIAGFRSKDLIILEDEMRAASSSVTILTDDGSNGSKGLVTDGLRARIESGDKYDLVIAIGPPIMMKFVSALTKEYGIKTIVSMNPIMIDGTGMCGACRVTVGGKMRFACVDGPDFDGHEVDFDELMRRNRMYSDDERSEREAGCRLMKKKPEED